MDLQTPPDQQRGMPALSSRLVIVMVGLPARGKSYIVKKLARYLNWLQIQTRGFNAGELRRKTASLQVGSVSKQSSPDFFDPYNATAVSKRDEIALQVLNELLDWIEQGGHSVGILDATNSTRERRQLVLERIRHRVGAHLPVLFLESRCFDTSVLERNFRLKLSGPDYRQQAPETALQDFRRRVALYEQAYTTMGPAEEAEGISYVQVTDVGRQMTTHMIRGFLSTQVVEYMLGFNLTDRQLWISCGGESTDDTEGRIGRHSGLSDAGAQYAEDLAGFIKEQHALWEEKAGQGNPAKRLPLSVWTSTWPQATRTAQAFAKPQGAYDMSESKLLDDVNARDMASLTFKEIVEGYPEVYAARKRHKLLYRWPGLGGESYSDVTYRLKPIILELERLEGHVLVISHRAIVRVLLAYFLDLKRADLTEMIIPRDCVYLVEPKPYGNEFHAYQYAHQRRCFEQVADANAKARFMAL